MVTGIRVVEGGVIAQGDTATGDTWDELVGSGVRIDRRRFQFLAGVRKVGGSDPTMVDRYYLAVGKFPADRFPNGLAILFAPDRTDNARLSSGELRGPALAAEAQRKKAVLLKHGIAVIVHHQGDPVTADLLDVAARELAAAGPAVEVEEPKYRQSGAYVVPVGSIKAVGILKDGVLTGR